MASEENLVLFFYVSTAAVQVKFYKLISVLRASLLLEDAKLEDTFTCFLFYDNCHINQGTVNSPCWWWELELFLILLLLYLVMKIFWSPKSCLSTSLSVYVSVFLSRDGIRSSRGKAEHLYVGIVTKIWLCVCVCLFVRVCVLRGWCEHVCIFSVNARAFVCVCVCGVRRRCTITGCCSWM